MCTTGNGMENMNTRQIEKPTITDNDFKHLVEHSPDLILWLSTTGHFLYANLTTQKLLGYTADELQSKTLYQLIKADKRSSTRKFYEAQVNEKTPHTYFEYPVLTKDGAVVWLGNIAALHETEQGVVLQCTARNINERVKADLQRENWMSRLLVLIENLQEGIMMVDENRRIALVNRTFCDLFSFRLIPEDLIGRDYINAQNHIKRMFKDPASFTEEENQITENMQVLISQRLDLINGKVYERDHVPIYIETGSAGSLWKYRDTTEKTRIKNELIRSQKKYKSVIDAMNLGLMEVGHDDRILNVNEAFCKMLAYNSADELIGKPSFDTLLDKEQQELMKVEMASRQEGDSSTYEIKAKRGDGTYAWLLINGAPLYDENHSVIGSVGIHLDITDQKRIAIEREERRALQNLMEWQEKAMQTLEEKVQQRTTEVVKQKQIIENTNLEITKSINYALRIQQSILPKEEEMQVALPDSFVLFKPRDIVSGDFYYLNRYTSDACYICAADSTGHGVPGGFMSMLGTEKLNEAVSRRGSPGEILSQMNVSIKNSLRISEGNISLLDGFDMALCHINLNDYTVDYAGALRPLWFIRKNADKIEEIKPTRRSIGGRTGMDQVFETHRLQLQKGDCIYMFTDGYTDQFSSESKRLSTRRLSELLLLNKDKPMLEQKNVLENFLNDWQGNSGQTDDILVMGVRL